MSNYDNDQLTEEQVERAARQYCLLSGLDPDESVAYGHDSTGGPTHDVLLYSPRWRRVAKDIVQTHRLNLAIKYAENLMRVS